MARVYADLIRKGLKVFAEVPDRIKEQVRQVLVEQGFEALAEEKTTVE